MRVLVSLLKFTLKLTLLAIVLLWVVILFFRWQPLPGSSFILQQNLQAEQYPKIYAKARYSWLSWQEISPNMALAVMASEDQRFLEHNGFDIGEIKNAIHDYQQGSKLRGASTISQQLAKNLFLWHGKSYLRKGLEVFATLSLELLWPKQRIIEAYLNVAQFGPATYGIKYAAQENFAKKAANLSENEAAWLAVVLPSPSKHKIHKPTVKMRKKQKWVLKHLRILKKNKVLDKMLKADEPQ